MAEPTHQPVDRPGHHPADPASRGGGSEASVVRSAEQLVVGDGWHRAERVVVRRRIVTEQRQITVDVRHEELVVEHLPLSGGGAQEPAPVEVLVLELHEEVPEVVLRTRAYERVTVAVQRVAAQVEVSGEVRHEEVEVVGLDGGEVDPPARTGSAQE